VKPAARGLGGTLLAIGVLIGVMFLVARKGLIAGLMVVLVVVVVLFGVTVLATLFGKRKKNG
jgi:hypothetical protein